MAKRIRELKTEVVATGKEKNVYRIFELIKRKESLAVTDQTTHFNNTELRLIAEVLAAKYVGKRLISTQLAQLLGVTRSVPAQPVTAANNATVAMMLTGICHVITRVAIRKIPPVRLFIAAFT